MYLPNIIGLSISESTIYLFNISKLYMQDYSFNWKIKKLNRSTEFKNNEQILKIVGTINIDEAVYTIECL